MKRRHFLKLATSLPLFGSGLLTLHPASADTAPGLFVADARLSGRAPLPRPRTLALVRGDIAPTWLATIRPYLGTGTAPLRGETLGDALFCLSVLATDHGWRLSEVREIATGQSPVHHTFNQETAYRWEMTRRDAVMSARA